ncbi:unnamed protein product, partial [Ectocarpus fasciculatus]
GVHGDRLAILGGGHDGGAALPRRLDGDAQKVPLQLQVRPRALPRAEERLRGQDVHPGPRGAIRRRGFRAPGRRSAHLLLRPEGNDARHHRHAGEGGGRERHLVGRQAQGAKEQGAVARRGLLTFFLLL